MDNAHNAFEAFLNEDYFGAMDIIFFKHIKEIKNVQKLEDAKERMQKLRSKLGLQH